MNHVVRISYTLVIEMNSLFSLSQFYFYFYFAGWHRGEKRAMKFSIPRIWQEPTVYSSSCYFCMVDSSKRRTGKNAPAITYPDLQSSIATVPHFPELPVEREQPSSKDSSTFLMKVCKSQIRGTLV